MAELGNKRIYIPNTWTKKHAWKPFRRGASHPRGGSDTRGYDIPNKEEYNSELERNCFKQAMDENKETFLGLHESNPQDLSINNAMMAFTKTINKTIAWVWERDRANKTWRNNRYKSSSNFKENFQSPWKGIFTLGLSPQGATYSSWWIVLY